jgi:hypothetical protein
MRQFHVSPDQLVEPFNDSLITCRMNFFWTCPLLPVLPTLALLLVTSPAHADDTPAEHTQETRTAIPAPLGVAPTVGASDRAQPPVTESRWYGWQTLLVDGASVAVAGASLTLNEEALAAGLLLGASGYAVGAPIVHLSHGQPVKALVSLGFRALTGGAGMLLLGLGASGGMYGLLLGAAAGAMLLPGAMVIDAAWLAREDVPSSSKDASRSRLTLPASRRTHAVRLAPTLEVQPTRFSAGLHGTF